MKRWQVALRMVGVGWYVGLCIVLGVVGGFWLDDRFGTSPVLVIVGLVLGVFIAFYGVYQMLLPLIRNKQDKEDG